jgi:predicted transcriptional regulator/transcriptional regulator with XRE-family HTH domain
MSRKVFAGAKIRRLREQRGLSQTALAKMLDVSPSYLNLMEHDQRPVTAPVLIKLSETLDVSMRAFSNDDEARLVTELREVFADEFFRKAPVSPNEIEAIAGTAPSVAHSVIDLYRAFRSGREENPGTSTADLAPRSELSAFRLASEEVSDFIQEQGNYFPDIETAASTLSDQFERSGMGLYAALEAHLRAAHELAVEVVPLKQSAGALRRYDRPNRRIILSELLPSASRGFHLAHQLGLIEHDALFDEIVGQAGFRNPDSRSLARLALANYFAGALLMPYDAFLASAQEARYDINILENRYNASFEQVCHRLTTLNKPAARGVPFHFVRLDIAGNISKRFSASGIQIARYGGACPRWNVHDAFLTPGMIRTQLSQMPDGSTYFCLARTVRKAGGGYRHAQDYLAIGLGCDTTHAHALVYADGVDVDNVDAALPIGVSCRICDRMNCRQRAFPPLNQRLDVDEDVRGPSAYVSADDFAD